MTKHLVARANLLFTGMLLAILALVGAVTWERLDAARRARQLTQHSYAVLGAVKDLALATRDAETGQRGFLLTGKDAYLAPYEGAVRRIGDLQGELQKLTAGSAAQQDRLRILAPAIRRKLQEMSLTVQLRRDVGFEAALDVVNTDAGRTYTKDIETTLAAMLADEQALLAERLRDTDARSALVRWLIVGGTVMAVAILLWAARLLNRAWLRSSRLEAEQRTLALRLRASLDSLSQGVAVFGADRRLTHWNGCFQVLLDLPDSLARVGTTYAELVGHMAEQGRPSLERDLEVEASRHRPGEPAMHQLVQANGPPLELRRTSMPDGGFVLTVTDMTKHAEAEAVLREAQKMQAIGQLTGGIAHDFNNMLQVVLGNLDSVRAKLDDDTGLRLRVERAIWAAQRGATLTAQLLAFARKQPLAPTPVDLAGTVPDLVPLLRRTLGEHIDIRYVASADLWPAMADPVQLESALLNLALNARDAMPEGGHLTIELGNRVLDDDYARSRTEVTAGDYAMLAVSDTGHGMAPEIAARVFEPFFTTKPSGKGTGLGLAMVFGFVKQSGGHVAVYSEPGEGTTVKLYLPRAARPAAAPPQRPAEPAGSPRGAATILVVEDETAVREIAATILTDLGYRVLEAADGEEGLRVFCAHAGEIDLLLSDVVLPGKIRGRDLSERVIAMRPEVRVLFMSGYTENSIVHHGRLDEGVQLIGKPFKREHLARKVAEALGAPGAAGDVP